MNEKEKQRIEKEAKAMLEKFAKALEKVKLDGKKSNGKRESYREEREGLSCDVEFRRRFLDNAPKTEGDCIVAEKAKW